MTVYCVVWENHKQPAARMVHYFMAESTFFCPRDVADFIIESKPLFCEDLADEDVDIVMVFPVPESFMTKRLYLGELNVRETTTCS